MWKIHIFRLKYHEVNKTFLASILILQSFLVIAQADSIEINRKKEMREYAEKDHLILDWDWSPDKSSQITIKVSIMNPYHKDIKSLWLTFSAFDEHGKPVKDSKTGKTSVVIESKRLHSGDGGYIDYKFEKVFTAKSVDEMRVEQVKLEFADNTFKVIKGSKAVGEL